MPVSRSISTSDHIGSESTPSTTQEYDGKWPSRKVVAAIIIPWIAICAFLTYVWFNLDQLYAGGMIGPWGDGEFVHDHFVLLGVPFTSMVLVCITFAMIVIPYIITCIGRTERIQIMSVCMVFCADVPAIGGFTTGPKQYGAVDMYIYEHYFGAQVWCLLIGGLFLIPLIKIKFV